MGEFELIARFFAPLAADPAPPASPTMSPRSREDGRAAGRGKSDAIVGGVHFLPDDPPDLIGRKLLRVNCPTWAGKGARPLRLPA